MNITQRNLSGTQYLATVTALLQRIRLEEPFGGLYETADLQWHWREHDAAYPERQVFWFGATGEALACFLHYPMDNEWNHDFIYLPSARQVVQSEVLPQVIDMLRRADRPSLFSVHENDTFLRNAIEAVGYVQSSSTFVITELQQDPAQSSLPAGYALTSRAEDERPHHLMRRNGAHIAEKLHECSLYRPELDLCVRDAAGSVAAYALFWFDPVTQVGLLEPLRTETAFQRLGLARFLIAEGTVRLRQLGAQSIRVATYSENKVATDLYHRMGFADRVTILEYRRE